MTKRKWRMSGIGLAVSTWVLVLALVSGCAYLENVPIVRDWGSQTPKQISSFVVDIVKTTESEKYALAILSRFENSLKADGGIDVPGILSDIANELDQVSQPKAAKASRYLSLAMRTAGFPAYIPPGQYGKVVATLAFVRQELEWRSQWYNVDKIDLWK